ncbi:interferon regulatory factor 4-like [Scleropages formosus]|uniref:Interferon regulatory factor 4-like n=1 Tax=Scleropages formosus TaxID=113540 RepID=A0A0P7XS20_SCLFO|nr:interferon regulatory factor 4-like [Scleropages formosus]
MMQESSSRAMRLRDWLILQIESGQYPGLTWHDAEKTLFRIPWKHAAKQDYRQREDAALFKAWAVYKGKYHEGKDRADPSVWKTRLRCALNKSSDFQEVPERNQLDISEPYKVYRIQSHGGKEGHGRPETFSAGQLDTPPGQSSKLHVQFGAKVDANGGWKERADSGGLYEHPYSTDIQTPPQGTLADKDFRLQVCLFYQGQLVQDFTTSTSGGCWIRQCPALGEDEHLYGPSAIEQVFFPPVEAFHMPASVCAAMARLLAHLQRGVVVWVAPDGLFIKRFCQGRVYWNGPLAQHRDRPNKLEREKTSKLLDVSIFFQELKQFLQGGPRPNFEINLCFGEEFPEPDQSKDKKLITAQIKPLFIKNLLRTIQRCPEEMKAQLQDPRQGQRQPPVSPWADSAMILETHSLAPS